MKKKDSAKLLDYSKLKFKVKKTMRYDDVGDYFDDTIVAFDMGNPVYAQGIMLHEFIEYTLIKSAGIPVDLIDAFDNDPATSKKHKKEYDLYTKYHRMANNVEREFIKNMGVAWKDYQKAVYSEKVKIDPKKNKEVTKIAKRWRVK